MLDIRRIRTAPDEVKAGLKKRGVDADIAHILAIDEERRKLIFANEQDKAKQNSINKQIPQFKKEGRDVAPIFDEMRALSADIKANDDRIKAIDTELDTFLMTTPNVPYAGVPYGRDSDDNVEMRRWGKPTEFAFEPQAHWDLGEKLGILNPADAAKVTGARFHFYMGLGARLERAITNFFLDTHVYGQGYTEVFPPFMVNRTSMTGTGQLPKFEEDAFKITGTEYFLVPTAEVPITNLHANRILSASDLPIKYCAYSACFRAEAGSAGRDTRGLIRQHQFNKVEMVKFADPETSYDELETLTADAEELLKKLGLPYRVVLLCSGDIGFSSAKTYDLEVWMPSYGRYVEISSCSNFEDFQARRANIRFKKDSADKPAFVHTLNGSGLAVGRTTAAILENFQNADGSVTVPEVLRPYMGGLEVIK